MGDNAAVLAAITRKAGVSYSVLTPNLKVRRNDSRTRESIS
jgi:hypothetical protein